MPPKTTTPPGEAASTTQAPVAYLEHEAQEALLHRLARIEGHVRAIARMVVARECADDILLQLTAVKGALNRFGATLVEEELKTCFTTCRAEEAPDLEERIDRLGKVLGTMLKQS